MYSNHAAIGSHRISYFEQPQDDCLRTLYTHIRGEGSNKLIRIKNWIVLGDQKILNRDQKINYHLRCQVQCFVDLAEQISWV